MEPGRGARTALARSGRWLLAAAVAVVLLFALRQPLADRLWPQARIDRLLAEGDRALAGGRLDQADGSGARQKYEAAQALDSDRGEARAGLARVGQAALARSGQAIAAGRRDEARRWLALAVDLQVPRSESEAVARRLREAELAGLDIGRVRAQAEAALAAGDPQAALPAYAQWLALAPGDAAALEGREDALALLLERVPPALREGDLATAAGLLSMARRHDPGHVGLPELQAAYAQALATQVRRASQALRAGRAGQAAQTFIRLLEVAPEDPAVLEGARLASTALAAHAREQAAGGRFDAAEETLAQARALGGNADGVAEAERAVASARIAATRARRPPASRGGASTVRDALDAFEASVGRGDWIEPPGASAYDHLRAAQALAPGDPAVRAAATRMQAAVRACVDESLRDNRLRAAQDCHDAWQALAPSDPGLAGARQRLAQRWLAVGEERLRAGEVDAAAHAFASARALDPAVPGLDDFAARLARAGASMP